MTVAWAAVAVAAATVVANVVGVWWAGRTQRRLARADRLGEREIEVYVDLLHWVKKIESAPSKSRGSWDEAVAALRMPSDLDIRVRAFASKRVRQRVSEVKDAWEQMTARIYVDDEKITRLLEQVKEPRDFEAVLAAVPEMDEARAASRRIEEAVRQITAPDAGRWSRMSGREGNR